MDFDEKKHESSEVVSAEEKQQVGELKRCCSDCRTTKTPLWRGGPAGPKSLCNACGIRYRKKRRDVLGLNNREEKMKIKKGRRKNRVGVSFKLRLLGVGGDVWLQRCLMQKQRKLAEEEEAAVLLMALSYGFVSA